MVLSPCLLLSCTGIASHYCVLSLPGCPSSLLCLCVSACGCCTWPLAHCHISWLHHCAMFMQVVLHGAELSFVGVVCWG